MEFTHLHNHSEYSFLDGVAKTSAMAKRAKELGHKSIAITDHGTMAGVIDFYSACEKEKIKPLLGIEFYMTPMGKSHLERVPYARQEYSDPKEKHRNNYHLLAIAKNEEGFSNLCKLTSLSFIDGFYMKNRIDMELLEKYHKGLIISSACLAGEINHFLSLGNYDRAREVARRFKEVFEDDFYMELQYGGIEQQRLIIPEIKKLAKELDITTIVTNDTHYVTRDESKTQNYMLLIAQRMTVRDEGGLHMGDELYLKDDKEMLQALPGEEQSLENTLEVADKVNLKIELGAVHIPVYDIKRDSNYRQYLLETGDIEEDDDCA